MSEKSTNATGENEGATEGEDEGTTVTSSCDQEVWDFYWNDPAIPIPDLTQIGSDKVCISYTDMNDGENVNIRVYCECSENLCNTEQNLSLLFNGSNKNPIVCDLKFCNGDMNHCTSFGQCAGDHCFNRKQNCKL